VDLSEASQTAKMDLAQIPQILSQPGDVKLRDIPSQLVVMLTLTPNLLISLVLGWLWG
jgi:hypothetical protein